jgi:ferrous iron transport protein B
VATVTGFAAKEVVVSTLGILYRTGGDQTGQSETLKEALRRDSAFNPLVAFVLMLFILTLAPCFAAQATIRAELGWKWLGFYIVYSFAVTWGLCFAVYQGGLLLGLGGK